MKIGIIGIGAIGRTLARKLAANGHNVRVANSRGPEAAREFADEIGATAVDVRGAVDGAELVVLSIPFPAVEKLPKDLFAKARQDLITVDTGNYYPGIRDPQIAEIDAGMTESVWVAKQLGRPIIKAFNNILAHSLAELGKPEGSSDRLAVAVAGDDVRSRQIVMGLVNEIGFDPLDGGTLEESWRQQPSTPGYCCDYGVEEMQRGLRIAVKGEARKVQDIWMKRIVEMDNPTHADMIELNQLLHPA